MTATIKRIDANSYQSSTECTSLLPVAYEILHQVRLPEAIYLQDITYSVPAGRGAGTFLCPRSDQFPNVDIGELTGAQLIDSVTQMAYCLTGLMIHGGVDLLGLDFEGFKDEIHAHRVLAVRTEVAFRHPCRFDRVFTIGATLHRFRNGELSVLRHNPLRYFVRIDLEGSQLSHDCPGTSLTILRARISACRRAR